MRHCSVLDGLICIELSYATPEVATTMFSNIMGPDRANLAKPFGDCINDKTTTADIQQFLRHYRACLRQGKGRNAATAFGRWMLMKKKGCDCCCCDCCRGVESRERRGAEPWEAGDKDCGRRLLGLLGICDCWRLGLPIQEKNWLGGIERLGPEVWREFFWMTPSSFLRNATRLSYPYL